MPTTNACTVDAFKMSSVQRQRPETMDDLPRNMLCRCQVVIWLKPKNVGLTIL